MFAALLEAQRDEIISLIEENVEASTLEAKRLLDFVAPLWATCGWEDDRRRILGVLRSAAQQWKEADESILQTYRRGTAGRRLCERDIQKWEQFIRTVSENAVET